MASNHRETDLKHKLHLLSVSACGADTIIAVRSYDVANTEMLCSDKRRLVSDD